MQKILVFGATGHVGKAIVKEANKHDYKISVVVRNKQKASDLSVIADIFVADVTDPDSLKGICNGFDIIISALGKSVSPNDRSKPGFRDVDLHGNSNILAEAKKAGIKKFIYISAFQAEKYLHLEYFKVHHEFSEKLKQSGINYSIIKPPAIFSAFIDMIDMARKGRLINIGKGNHTTNPIYEGDLAEIVVNSISQTNTIIEAGGGAVYTRAHLNQIIQKEVAPEKKIRSIPLGIFKLFLPLIKLFDKNMYHKFAFFIEVMQHDTIAPKFGTKNFEEYIRENK